MVLLCSALLCPFVTSSERPALRLAASGAAFPPELAVGWMAARLSRRLRMPLNVAIAAGAVRVAPALSDLTVTPLLTGLQPGEGVGRALQLHRCR